MHTLTYTITNFPDMYMTQTMETNFPDVLNEDESVQLFMDIVGNGRGMTMWARTYVVPIVTRYLHTDIDKSCLRYSQQDDNLLRQMSQVGVTDNNNS